MGSAVGLTLGLKAAGLRTQVVAVRTATPRFSSARKVQRMHRRLARHLREADPSFPDVSLDSGDILIREEHVGRGDAAPTAKALQAIALARECSGLVLDWTYTGKAFAALIDDAPLRARPNVLFWHTYNTRPIELSDVDYRRLPHALHEIFRSARPGA